MKNSIKTQIANGWLSLMWISFATIILIIGVEHTNILLAIIVIIFMIKMTIWAVNHLKK